MLVGGRVAVGVTRLTGISRLCPTKIEFASVSLLKSTMSSTVLLNSPAMPASESPDCTIVDDRPAGQVGRDGGGGGELQVGIGDEDLLARVDDLRGRIDTGAAVSLYGLSSRISGIPSSPRLNFSTMAASESPSWTVYRKGAEGVKVGVSVAVAVIVGVTVGVDVIVGVKVSVGVGVSVAKRRAQGLTWACQPDDEQSQSRPESAGPQRRRQRRCSFAVAPPVGGNYVTGVAFVVHLPAFVGPRQATVRGFYLTCQNSGEGHWGRGRCSPLMRQPRRP